MIPNGLQKCNECLASLEKEKPQVPRGYWQCKAVDCRRILPKKEFSEWQAPRTNKNKNDGMQRCNNCMRAIKTEFLAQQRDNLDKVCKRKRT